MARWDRGVGLLIAYLLPQDNPDRVDAGQEVGHLRAAVVLPLLGDGGDPARGGLTTLPWGGVYPGAGEAAFRSSLNAMDSPTGHLGRRGRMTDPDAGEPAPTPPMLEMGLEAPGRCGRLVDASTGERLSRREDDKLEYMNLENGSKNPFSSAIRFRIDPFSYAVTVDYQGRFPYVSV